MATPRFWLQILLVYIIAFSLRVVERAARWLFFPNDNMVLAEIERVVRPRCDLVTYFYSLGFLIIKLLLCVIERAVRQLFFPNQQHVAETGRTHAGKPSAMP